MKFKLVVLVIVLCALGGAGYGVRTYLHNADPTVKADRLIADNKLREAVVELRNAARANPKDGDVHVRIGQLQSKLADPVAAEREFRIGIQLGADRATVAPDLGEAILVQGRYRDMLRDIPARGPTPAVLAKVLLLRAVAQLSLDDVPAAEATLADAEARAPGQAQTALIAARVAAAHNDLPVMRNKVAEVLRLDPNQVEALLMQEKLVALQGNRAEALALTDKAVRAAPWSAMAKIDRASQLMLAGDDGKAQADVDAVLQAQPRFMDAVYLNGILMARRGQFTEAAAQLGKLDNVSARLPQGLYFQALIALQQGNLQTASDFARRYATLVPNDPDGLRVVAQTELALGHAPAALPTLLKLVAAVPTDAEAFDMLGRAYAATGKSADSAKAFTTALGLKPDDPLIRFHAGAQQLQSGKVSEAVANLETAFARNPKTPGLGPILIEAYLSAGDPAKAEDALARVRAATGDTDELALLAALAKLRQNDTAGARTLLTEAVRKYPNSLDLRTQLAQVLSREGRLADAQALLTAVLAKEPAKLSALSASIDLMAGDKDLTGAIRLLDTAHRAAPRDAAVTSMLADGLIANKDPQRAIDMIRDTGADSAIPPLVAAALGRAQIALGRPVEAKAVYRASLAEHPDNLMVRGSLAELLSGEKDYPAVQATLQEALAIYPGNYTLLSGLVANEGRWKGLDAAAKLADDLRQQPNAMPAAAELKGDLYVAANRPVEAAWAYAADYARDPSLSLAVKAAGAMAVSNQLDGASALLTSWLKAHPDDAEAAQRLAQIDIQAGRYAEAQTHLGIVLAARPNSPVALNNLAWSYFMTGDARALPTARRAYLQDPGPLAADTLGWVLVKGGSAKAAVPILQRAAEQRPDRSIQYHLAAALGADGQKAEALKVLQPLVIGPAFADQDAARTLASDLSR